LTSGSTLPIEKVCIVGSEPYIVRNGQVPALFFSFLVFPKGSNLSPPTSFICFVDFVHPDLLAPCQIHHCRHERCLYYSQLFFDVDSAPPRVEGAAWTTRM
jgi:hypothetical protein